MKRHKELEPRFGIEQEYTLMKRYKELEPRFGIEQEYTLMKRYKELEPRFGIEQECAELLAELAPVAAAVALAVVEDFFLPALRLLAGGICPCSDRDIVAQHGSTGCGQLLAVAAPGGAGGTEAGRPRGEDAGEAWPRDRHPRFLSRHADFNHAGRPPGGRRCRFDLCLAGRLRLRAGHRDHTVPAAHRRVPRPGLRCGSRPTARLLAAPLGRHDPWRGHRLGGVLQRCQLSTARRVQVATCRLRFQQPHAWH